MAQLQATGITGSLTTSGNTTIDTSNDVLAALRITQRGTGHSLLVEDTTNPDSSPFVIDNAGNVGIGTSTISSKLNVAGDISVFTGNQIYASTGSATRPAYSFLAAEGNNGFFRPSADTIAISTNGVERARITSTGNFGIGTNSPNTKLDVNGNAIITGSLTTTDDLFVNGGDATIASSTTKQAILNLSSSQYGGVINTYGSSSTSNLSFKAEENQVMSLLNSPSLGTKLTIEDPFGAGSRYCIKSGANEVAQFIVSDGVSIGTIVSEDFYLSTANIPRVKIGSSSADLTLLAGNLVFGTAGKGIDFSANSFAAGMTSEVLSDYEEGTWTPVFSGSTTAGSYVYLSQTGRYTKIGNIAYISCIVDINSINTSATGSMRIAGLPFSVANTPSGNEFYMSAVWQGFTTSATNVFAAASDAGSWIDLHIQTLATSTNSFANILSPADVGTGGIRFTGFYRTA